jgi:hypothetical protein
VLEIEPSKGGDKQNLTVDVVLVSAGAQGSGRDPAAALSTGQDRIWACFGDTFGLLPGG